MKVLYEAIFSKFTALDAQLHHNAFYTSINGELHLGVARQDIVFPFATYHLVSNVPEYLLGGMMMENILFQINLYSDHEDSDEITTIFENQKALFDNCNLTVTGWNPLSIQRELSMMDKHIQTDTQIAHWQYITQYRVILVDP